MFYLDKPRFGAFTASLRREKGMTQKELAQQLFVSDKAVSKWETGVSVPSIDLLVPLAETLGVTVTELLLCQRVEGEETLSTEQVEQVVQTAISCSEGEGVRAFQSGGKWGRRYLLSLAAAAAETLLLCIWGQSTVGLLVAVSLGAVFGGYFCLFVRETLPAYYEENRIGAYQDGLFTLNLPGLSLRRSNWGKLLRVCRVWSLSLLLLYPVVSWGIGLLFAGRTAWGLDLALSLLWGVGGLFVPLYAVGKKYE